MSGTAGGSTRQRGDGGHDPRRRDDDELVAGPQLGHGVGHLTIAAPAYGDVRACVTSMT